MGNSLRDEMKDALRDFLRKRTGLGETPISADIVNEMTHELADVVFNVMLVPEEIQDLPYATCKKTAREYAARERMRRN